MLANLTAVVAAVHNCAAQCDLNYRCQAYFADDVSCFHHIPGSGLTLLRDWQPRTPIAAGCNASMAFCRLNESGLRVPKGFVEDRPIVVEVSAGVALVPGAITRPAGQLTVMGHGPVTMLGCGPLVVSRGSKTTVSGLALSQDGSQCTPMVSAVQGTVEITDVESAVVTGNPTGNPPTVTVVAENVAELGIGHVGGKVTITNLGKLVLQLTRSARLEVLGEASCTVNVSELTGAFTPEFESVFAGNKPDLGPDPELIRILTTVFGVVAVLAWSGVFVEGLDRFTEPTKKEI